MTTNNQPTTDLATTDQVPRDLREAPDPNLQNHTLQFWSSMDMDDPIQKLQIAEVLAADDVPIWDVLGKAINCKHLLTKVSEKVDRDTGEIIQALRLLIISDKNEVYSTMSKYCVQDMLNIVHLFGVPPWSPPIVVFSKKVRTRGGNDVMRISVNREETTKLMKRKKDA